jgi:hypothetical protein
MPEAGVVARLRRAKTASEAEEAVAALTIEHPARQLVEFAARAPSRSAALAEINERLSELDADLGAGSLVPKAAARVCAFIAVLLAIVELARTLPQGVAYGTIGAVLLVGIAGASTSALLGRSLLGRSADTMVSQRREVYDALSGQLERVVTQRFGPV